MTLGKVERFWSTIWQEFLARVPIDSFEAARERIRLWNAYYNHKRPHQGIGGVCPADRYFEAATELRKTMSAGVADNVLEMALRECRGLRYTWWNHGGIDGGAIGRFVGQKGKAQVKRRW